MVVGDQDETGADFLVELKHQGVDLCGIPLVQITGRLVTEHAGRAGHEGTRHSAALTLATGKFGRLVVRTITQPDPLQQSHSLPLRLGNRGAADQQRHAHIFQRSEFGEQMVELVDEAQRAIAHPPAFGIGKA